jgi:hypothetical protein
LEVTPPFQQSDPVEKGSVGLPRRIIGQVLAALVGVSAGNGPAGAATQIVKVNAQVSKPLTLTLVQNLDLGTIVLGPGIWSAATVSISRSGTFSCGNINVTCTGTAQVATYNATGSNGETARITAPNVTLTNQSDPTKILTLVIDNPGTVAFTNSGSKGVNFSLGGSISLSSATTAGIYNGTFNVTVDY